MAKEAWMGNGDVGPAYTTLITGLTLKQLTGAPCSATITPPGGAFPVALGDIPTSGTATAHFSMTFKGCGPLATFVVQAPWTWRIRTLDSLSETSSTLEPGPASEEAGLVFDPVEIASAPPRKE
jgi:hypothetical protein